MECDDENCCLAWFVCNKSPRSWVNPVSLQRGAAGDPDQNTQILMEQFFSTERMALMIPIIAIVLVGMLGLAMLVLRFARRRRVFELYHLERMAAIEKGIEIPSLPDALLLDGRGPRTPAGVLLRGLVWLFLGIGFFFAMHEHDSRVAMFGLMPVGVGMAYLIYYFAEGRKAAVVPPDEHGPNPPLTAIADAKS